MLPPEELAGVVRTGEKRWNERERIFLLVASLREILNSSAH
jgi:hypothetical protein